MITLFFALLSLSFLPSAPPAPVVTWLTPMEYDFGDIQKGRPVTCDFQYRNDGSEPLVIDTVRPGCGCTTPDWSAEPLPPDSTRVIQVTFDARIPGHFHKLVKIYFQGQRKAEKLYVTGFVVGEE